MDTCQRTIEYYPDMAKKGFIWVMNISKENLATGNTAETKRWIREHYEYLTILKISFQERQAFSISVNPRPKNDVWPVFVKTGDPEILIQLNPPEILNMDINIFLKEAGIIRHRNPAFKHKGIETVGNLIRLSIKEILLLDWVGPDTIEKILAKLEEHGFGEKDGMIVYKG